MPDVSSVENFPHEEVAANENLRHEIQSDVTKWLKDQGIMEKIADERYETSSLSQEEKIKLALKNGGKYRVGWGQEMKVEYGPDMVRFSIKDPCDPRSRSSEELWVGLDHDWRSNGTVIYRRGDPHWWGTGREIEQGWQLGMYANKQVEWDETMARRYQDVKPNVNALEKARAFVTQNLIAGARPLVILGHYDKRPIPKR